MDRMLHADGEGDLREHSCALVIGLSSALGVSAAPVSPDRWDVRHWRDGYQQ
jgi:hypothetical protein